MTTGPESLAVVVGRNCRRIRTTAGITQNELAKHARDVGLRWTASKVGDFESGRNNPSFATVLAVAAALSIATGTDVGPADLVTSDGFVAITDTLDPHGAVLAAVMRGERSWQGLRAAFARKLQRGIEQIRREAQMYPGLDDVETDGVLAIERRSGRDEDRLAKRLQISGDLLAAASWRLWQQSFSDERDERAGPGANAQTRGRWSRILQDELRAQLQKAATDGNHQ